MIDCTCVPWRHTNRCDVGRWIWDLADGVRRDLLEAPAGEGISGAGYAYRGALLIWLCTPVISKVTLQQGRSAAPFVSWPAQRSPALRARRASVLGSYLGVHLPPVTALSSLSSSRYSLLVIHLLHTCLVVARCCSALLPWPAANRQSIQFPHRRASAWTHASRTTA